MTIQEKVQVKTKTQVHAADHGRVKVEVAKGAIVIMAAVPSLIGIWGMACFVGAMVAGGGPLGAVTSWVSAVSGM